MEPKSLETGRTECRYYVSGTGTNGFLFLSGMLGAGPAIAEFLATAFPARKIIVPAHARVESIADYLHAIRLILERENISNTTVYGASFGSLIAQCFAKSNVDKTSQLILSGAAAPDISRVRSNQIWLRLLPFLPLFMIKTILLVTLRSLLRDHQTVWLVEYRQLIKNLTKADLISRYKIAIDFDKNYFFQADDFHMSSFPILLLEGEADKVAGEKIRDRLRSVYPHAAVHVFRGAGHSILFTHQEEWKGVIRDFLKT